MATMRMYGDTSGYTDLTVPDVGTNGVVTLPTSGEMITATSGTFTPTFLNGSFTLTTQAGNYYRLGDLWWISIRMIWSAVSGTGNLVIQGLPCRTENVTDNYSGLAIAYHTGTDTGADTGNLSFVINPNAAAGTFYNGISTFVTPASKVENCNASGQVILSGTLWGQPV